jgi:hypothetical protein
MPVKNYCIITKSSGRKRWTRVTKWKAVALARDGPGRSCGKKALHRQIFIVGYLQFLERHHLQAAQCSGGYGASTVASTLNKRLSVSSMATPLESGLVKPSGNSEGDGNDL